jgi:hypothetical protein
MVSTNRMAQLSCLALFFFLTVTFDVMAQGTRSVQAVRVDGTFTVDGKLDEASWSQALAFDAPLEIDPRENLPALQRTEIRLLYTEDALLVSFVCHDTNMSELRAHLSNRDRMFQDDHIILILDTYGDSQKAYEFFVNPLNVQGDALRANDNEDDSYEMVWQSAASIGPTSWTVEMEIPFKSLRFPDQRRQNWKILAGRNYPRITRAVYSASPIDRNDPCLTCQGMPLLGIEGIEPGLATELLPYVGASQAGALRDTEDPASPFEQGKIKARTGIGIKVSPTPDATIEAVVNPDFSQIESDAAQISVNTTFNLFYPERRPFFLEGSDLFRANGNGFGGPALQLFYSRTINDPIVATKVIGKAGALSYGAIAAADRNTSLFVPGEEQSDLVGTGMSSLASVARIRYDFGDQSYVGGVLSHRSIRRDASNVVGGADFNYRWDQNHSIRGALYLSRTDELSDTSLFDDARSFSSTGHTAAFDGETYGGLAARLELSRSTREMSASVTFEDISPTFQAQNGFITRTDHRTISFAAGYTVYPDEGSRLTRWGVNGFTGMQFNYLGQRKERFLFVNSFANFKGQINLSVGLLALNQERFRGFYFPRIPRFNVNVNGNPNNSFSFGVSVEAGNYIYRDGDPPELGYGHNAALDATMKVTERLRVATSYNRARLSSDATGELFYEGNIYRATGYYYFNTEAIMRVIMQYDTFSKGLNTYPLFSYRLNAFTVFYAGATRDLTNFTDRPAGWTTTQTQYFLKLQYLIQS